ncbi:grasp-with-spasm system SPASM domain peptide maturase [Fluviicola taffensis]|uniref:Grasp-with-spasm system SPASM domain peptide maturase n=1 Tax=Fluviicola taffensis (strain DSM 16823 / NCIMB 13979 / RW262) TaxID=755732 RepID=F2I962_FLUTR|nr:grasp-with-spasm system SPASM domain peptide maturase [Fluviicola taffensis]AEA43009.1 hypothetical protein Fluta_1011 [Fluviicola taffensis DSM 16823]
MTEDYFVFFASCMPVYGRNGITICDTQYGEIHWFPHDLQPLIESIDKRIPIIEMKKKFSDSDDGLEQFLDHFSNKKLGFYTKNPNVFPKLSMDWYHPSKVTNAIIDFDTCSTHKIEHIIDALDHLLCPHIQIRYFQQVNKESIIDQLISVKGSSVNSIDIVLTHPGNLSIDDLKTIYASYSQINSFTLFNAEDDRIVDDVPFLLSYMKREITNEKSCGLITENHFSSNIKLFTESIDFNNCLNRKVSIDRTGAIKNCPSMETSYGTVPTTNLLDVIDLVLNNPVTKIKKTEIQECDSCEYRMVCTDCRAYVDNPADIYSKPLKCGYNPVTTEWADWSTNTLKEKAIKFYQLDNSN